MKNKILKQTSLNLEKNILNKNKTKMTRVNIKDSQD